METAYKEYLKECRHYKIIPLNYKSWCLEMDFN
jgi:hypothetical protein